MDKAASLDTREHLLNIAERLFGEHGFAGTTLRHLASEAQANLGAVNYYFGSKEELYRTVVRRFSQPVIAHQLEMLADIQFEPSEAALEEVLTAFFAPPLEFITRDESARVVRAQFMGRCRVEADPIQGIAREEFSASHEAFLPALQRVLPEQARSELQWKFDLLVAALIRVQIEAGKPEALLRSSHPEDVQHTIEQLVRFMAAGMRA